MRLWDRNGPRARVPFFCRCPGICRRGFPPEIPAAAPSPGPSRAPLPRRPRWPPGAPPDSRETASAASGRGVRARAPPHSPQTGRPSRACPPSKARSLLPGSRLPRPSPPPSPGLSTPPPPPARFRGRLPQEKGGGPPRLRGPRPCRPRPAATAGSRSRTPGRALVTCRHPASRREEARPRDRRPALRARRSSQRPRATHAASPASPPSSAERVTETWASVRSCSSRPPRPSLLLRSAR